MRNIGKRFLIVKMLNRNSVYVLHNYENIKINNYSHDIG